MALQNFIDKVGPVVSAAWLNTVDVIKDTIFANAATKAQARTALTSDAPLEVANGGTAVRALGDMGVFRTELDIAAAATVDLGTATGHSARVIGTGVNITSFGSSANVAAPFYFVRFQSGNTLVNSSNLLLPGNANIVTQDRDFAICQYLGGGVWDVKEYNRQAVNPDAVAVTYGSFTPTWNGFSGYTNDVLYTKFGNMVTLYFKQGLGTSTSTGFSMTGLPANLRAATSVLGGHSLIVAGLIDNWPTNTVALTKSVILFGASSSYTDDSIIFVPDVTSGSTNSWTASGNKGFAKNVCITYTTTFVF